MHPAIFGIKRAFLTSTTFLRRQLRRHFGLTQARFDVLYVLHSGYSRQLAVRRHLGVTSSTISETLRALELLGLVWRKPNEFDRRARDIFFTPEGRKRTEAVIEQWIKHRAGLRMVRDIFLWKSNPSRAQESLGILESWLFASERWFARTTAHNPYPDFLPDY